jgi:hypothetical protein
LGCARCGGLFDNLHGGRACHVAHALNLIHDLRHDGERDLQLVAKQFVLKVLLVADGAQHFLDWFAVDEKKARDLTKLLDLIHRLVGLLARELRQAELFAERDAAKGKGAQLKIANLRERGFSKRFFG